MGLFGRNKKNSGLFDKNIEPKCAYCENGKPARSKGKILCQRSGIVDGDYSCKKFKYSPFLRIPERGHAAERTEGDESVSEQTQDMTAEDTAAELKNVPEASEEPSGESNQSDGTEVSEGKVSDDENNEAEKSEEKKKETPLPAYIFAEEPKAEEKKPEQIKADKKPAPAAVHENKTLPPAPAERRPAPPVSAERRPAPPTPTEKRPAPPVPTERRPAPPTPTERRPAPPAQAERRPAPSAQTERRPAAPAPTERKATQPVSNINNRPSDNSQRLAKLGEVKKPSVSSINNYIKPVEINLPDPSETAVSSIENKPVKRDTEGYLKTVSVGHISEIKNPAAPAHQLPPDTKSVSVSDLNNKNNK